MIISTLSLPCRWAKRFDGKLWPSYFRRRDGSRNCGKAARTINPLKDLFEGVVPGYDAKAVPDIRHAIQIAASAESIFPIIATARGWTRWWAEDVVESGGVIELGFFNRTTIYRLKPLTQKPPQRSEWLCECGKEWSGTRLLFELKTAGTATNLHFIHASWECETEYFTNCNTTWGELMYRIKSAAEGDPRGPLFLVSSLAY